MNNIQNCYRKKQSKIFVQEILDKTTVPLQFIENISENYNLVPYHNFDHALMSSHGLLMMIGPHLQDILGVYCASMLGHDAGHSGYPTIYDEMNAVKITLSELTLKIAKKIHSEEYEYFAQDVRDRIIATTFSTHRYSTDLRAQIMQDADLSVWGLGLEYVLYTIFGIMDEFNAESERQNKKLKKDYFPRRIYTPVEFVTVAQKRFFEKVTDKCRVNLFQSQYAKKNLKDPFKVYCQLQALYDPQIGNDKAIQKAYDLRFEDITLKDFAWEVLHKKIK